MDTEAFQERVKQWRIDAGLSQEALDQECGFKSGTIGRIERGTLKLTDDRLVTIVICTKRDLLWTLAETYGSLLKRLQPIEVFLRQQLGKAPPPNPPDKDEEFEQALASMLMGAETVFRKQMRASDPRTLIADVLLEAAARDVRGDEPERRRIRGPRKKESSEPPPSA
jgi:transcriptional regulator with XRE-family HTH domain